MGRERTDWYCRGKTLKLVFVQFSLQVFQQRWDNSPLLATGEMFHGAMLDCRLAAVSKSCCGH